MDGFSSFQIFSSEDTEDNLLLTPAGIFYVTAGRWLLCLLTYRGVLWGLINGLQVKNTIKEIKSFQISLRSYPKAIFYQYILGASINSYVFGGSELPSPHVICHFSSEPPPMPSPLKILNDGLVTGQVYSSTTRQL